VSSNLFESLNYYDINIYIVVLLVRDLGGEGRNFNRGEGRGDILIKIMFGSQGEGRDFKIILLFYP